MNLFTVYTDLLLALSLDLKRRNPDKSYIVMRASLKGKDIDQQLTWFDEVDPDFFEGRDRTRCLPEMKVEEADRSMEYFKVLIQEASRELDCPPDRLGVNILVDRQQKITALGLANKDHFLDKNPTFLW